LSDEQWEFIKPHLPPQPIVGRKRADDRKTTNGILYVLIIGCRWHDMPRCASTPGEGSSGGQKKAVGIESLLLLKSKLTQSANSALIPLAVDSTLIDSKKVANPRGTADISAARM
jgi:hypothetical protein